MRLSQSELIMGMKALYHAVSVESAKGQAFQMAKQTIAEFVTDQETSDLLRAQGVDYAQGYHISRPQPVEDVLARWSEPARSSRTASSSTTDERASGDTHAS
jgi:EAL domain-containing protein (putative c-di-GMP-specific phosphodiesterase class I)